MSYGPVGLQSWQLTPLSLLCGWLVDICPLAKFLMHLQAGTLGNKERQWPMLKPVQPHQELSGHWARSICQSVPLIFPLHFFLIEIQIYQCGSKTTNQGFLRSNQTFFRVQLSRMCGLPASFGAHQVWHTKHCWLSRPLPRIIISFPPSSLSFSSFSSF